MVILQDNCLFLSISQQYPQLYRQIFPASVLEGFTFWLTELLNKYEPRKKWHWFTKKSQIISNRTINQLIQGNISIKFSNKITTHDNLLKFSIVFLMKVISCLKEEEKVFPCHCLIWEIWALFTSNYWVILHLKYFPIRAKICRWIFW